MVSQQQFRDLDRWLTRQCAAAEQVGVSMATTDQIRDTALRLAQGHPPTLRHLAEALTMIGAVHALAARYEDRELADALAVAIHLLKLRCAFLLGEADRDR